MSIEAEEPQVARTPTRPREPVPVPVPAPAPARALVDSGLGLGMGPPGPSLFAHLARRPAEERKDVVDELNERVGNRLVSRLIERAIAARQQEPVAPAGEAAAGDGGGLEPVAEEDGPERLVAEMQADAGGQAGQAEGGEAAPKLPDGIGKQYEGEEFEKEDQAAGSAAPAAPAGATAGRTVGRAPRGASRRLLQRKETEGTSDAPRFQYYVIADAGLNAGSGISLRSLADLPAALIRGKRTDTWTLVLSIHGGQDKVADQTSRNVQATRVYQSGDIPQIFGGGGFGEWRTKYGPTRLVLAACQVNADLEGALISAITRSGQGAGGQTTQQSEQGLGKGCRPHTTTVSYSTRGGTKVTRRDQFDKLPQVDKDKMLADLRALNEKYGYFGAPPVPAGEILRYYFDEPPLGGWAKVVVSKDYQPTEIPFYNRIYNKEFQRLCGSGAQGDLGTYKPGEGPVVLPPR